MGIIYLIVFGTIGLVMLIGFLRIFSIDASLREILGILKKHYAEKKP